MMVGVLKTGEYQVGSVVSNLKALLSNWSDTPALDSQVLVAHVCGMDRAWILAHPEAILTPTQQDALHEKVSLLEAGRPLPYVLGHWEFYGLDMIVNPDVLIPRPETELIVEQGVEWLLQHPNRRTAIDIGTGSGCIAVSLAVHVGYLQITGTDISPAALEVATANAIKHQVAARVNFLNADLLPANIPTFDLICANLPYIPSSVLKGLLVFEREPALALDGGLEGLDFIRRLLPQARDHLSSNGLVLLEIEASQGNAVIKHAQETFPGAQIDLLQDLAGRDRILRIETYAL